LSYYSSSTYTYFGHDLLDGWLRLSSLAVLEVILPELRYLIWVEVLNVAALLAFSYLADNWGLALRELSHSVLLFFLFFSVLVSHEGLSFFLLEH